MAPALGHSLLVLKGYSSSVIRTPSSSSPGPGRMAVGSGMGLAWMGEIERDWHWETSSSLISSILGGGSMMSVLTDPRRISSFRVEVHAKPLGCSAPAASENSGLCGMGERVRRTGTARDLSGDRDSRTARAGDADR